jgi:hypothetical protein
LFAVNHLHDSERALALTDLRTLSDAMTEIESGRTPLADPFYERGRKRATKTGVPERPAKPGRGLTMIECEFDHLALDVQ